MIDDELPRRKQSKGALAIAPGLLMRAVMYSPKDFAAGFVAFAAICAIVGNAIFLQAGRHPSPMFGTPSFSSATTPMIPNPLPRPRPIEAAQPADKLLDSRLFDGKPVETRAQPRPEQKPEPRVELKPEPKVETKAETKPTPRAADPMAGLIRNASAQRPAAVTTNPNVPRPPASVPTRGDPLGDLISGRGGR
jgi:hypothetical protein